MGTLLLTFDSCIQIIQTPSRLRRTLLKQHHFFEANNKLSVIVKIMAPGPTPLDSSDVPPYNPTDLILPTVVFVPPYTETATQDPPRTNETATADPAVANETPKPRRWRREGCPLSSHSWVLWVLWLYCSALFSVEIAELICLLRSLLSPV